MLETNSSHIKPSFIEYLVLALIIFLAFYLGCSSYPILDMNEGLYAEIAREMLSSQHYVIPHLNYLPYLEKPPLLYWLLALSYKLWGVNEFAARIIPTSCSALSCLLVAWFGHKLGQARAGWLGALILASSLGFILIGRTVFFDPLLNLWIWLSLGCFYLWYHTDRLSYLRVAYGSLALGLLTKGFVALVFPMGIATIFLLTESCGWQKRWRLFDGWGILIFLSIGLPWHILAIQQQPHFGWDYFINEQFYRFLDKRIPNDYHTGPIYFYLPLILVYLFPWCLLLPLVLKTTLKDCLQKFLWLCFLLPMLFYSISKAKGDYYMVVGMPPLALLLGIVLARNIAQNKIRALWRVLLSLTVLLVLITGLVYYANVFTMSNTGLLAKLILPPELKTTIGGSLLATSAYLILASLGCSIFRSAKLMAVLLTGVALAMTACYVKVRQLQQNTYSQKEIATFLKSHVELQPVYLYQDFERLSSLLFYYQKRLPIIDSQSQDLYFGSHTDKAQGGFMSGEQFLAQSAQDGFIVMRNDRLGDFNQLLAGKFNLQVVFQAGRTRVVKLKPS